MRAFVAFVALARRAGPSDTVGIAMAKAPVTAKDSVREAREQLTSGKVQDALRTLTLLCSSGPDPLAAEGAVPEVGAVLADLARAFGDADLASKLAAVRATPDYPNVLYEAAYALFEQRQYALASALLYRANAHAPGETEIVGELATSLEHQLRYTEAALVVDTSGIAEHDRLGAYLSGFHWMMVGDVDRARARLARLAGAKDARIAFMRDALAGMVARADGVRAAGIALDDQALTAWQAVLSGTLLLHASPHGYPDPMRGRYAFVADSAGLEREGLERANAVLGAMGQLPPRVVHAPDRASRILGLAAAKLFGVPCQAFRAADAGAALVVAWSLECAEDRAFLQAMHDHRPGQTLFVHASSWTEPFPYAPDVTTLLYQQVTNPWTGGALRVDPETNKVVRAESDARTDEEIAREILGATIADPSKTGAGELIAIARAIEALPEAQRGGLGRSSGKRMHQRAGGPVPSNRFL
jgi:hypothetical protein